MNNTKKSENSGESTKKTLIKEIEPMKETKVSINPVAIILSVAIILLGVITGYLLSQSKSGGKIVTGGKTAEGLAKVVGVKDEKTFKDSAEGTIREGGIDGTGSHHLERAGGESQTVYLTSSTVPLDDYIDKKVKIWGETFAAEKAGWFMDVGRLELME